MSSARDDLATMALSWIWRMADLLADSATPWSHGTIYRSERFPRHGDLNAIRVARDPGMSAARLAEFADHEQAGCEHRRLVFDHAAAAEPLRAEFEARGYVTTRLLWMHFEGPRPEPGGELVSEVADERVDALRLEWQQDEHPQHDPRPYLAETAEVRRRLGNRVLAIQEKGEPIGFAGLELAEDEAELAHLYVRAPYRGRGLGTKLTQAAITAANVPYLWICADERGAPSVSTPGSGSAP